MTDGRLANTEACLGLDCTRRQDCLRHAVLSGNVPCFPLDDHRCRTDAYEGFLAKPAGGVVQAVSALHRHGS